MKENKEKVSKEKKERKVKRQKGTEREKIIIKITKNRLKVK